MDPYLLDLCLLSCPGNSISILFLDSRILPSPSRYCYLPHLLLCCVCSPRSPDGVVSEPGPISISHTRSLSTTGGHTRTHPRPSIPKPFNKLFNVTLLWSSSVRSVTVRSDHNMDPAHVFPSMDTDSSETPTAMQRLKHTEVEVHQMSGVIASLLQLGNQQQQQLQQQQQQLAEITQLLTRLIPASGPAQASLPTGPAPANLPDGPVPASLLAGPAPASVLSSSEPKIGNPERFSGDPAQVRAFLTSCRVQFSLQPRTFATEGARVGYVITHLTGRARLWGTAEYDRQTPACATFDRFAEEMLKVFDLGSSTAEASQALMSIRQGRRTVADYSIDFRTLASRSSWNMEALVDAFLHSLADYMKDELVSHEQPSSLDEAIALATRIDQRIQTRRRERGRQSTPATGIRNKWTDPFPASATPPNQLDQPETMEIGRTSLPPAERQRRITSNLCLYCGGDGHRVATCPVKGQARRT